MGSCKVFKTKDGKVGTVKVDTDAFGTRSPRRVQRDAVLMYQANKRAGTHATLTRANITATKHKPWRQKGSGRARSGRRSSPIWRGGGVAHGPHPRDYSYNVPRKALRVAARASMAGKFLDDEVVFADSLSFDAPSTKQAKAMLDALEVTRTCLVVTAEHEENTWKSFRNLPGVDVMPASDVNSHEILRHRHVLLTKASYAALLERLGGAQGEKSAAASEGDDA